MCLCKEENRIIPLRPHHGMCLAYFKGEGYSDGFSAHMAEMLEIFETGADICLQIETDEICRACPNNRERLCMDQEKVERYDKAVLELCGLTQRQILNFGDFVQLVEKNILSQGKRKGICGDCQWNFLCDSQKSRWKEKKNTLAI